MGICNGFQVLTEAHLLPGALQKNKGLAFLCQMTELEVVSDRSPLTAGVEVGRRLRVPINHFEGNYTASASTLRSLEAEGRVVLRYVGNPNGSVHDIAAVCNEGRNVVGLMPHPERATSELLGSSDGLVLLGALLATAGSNLVAAPASARRRKSVTNPHQAPFAGGSSDPLLYGGLALGALFIRFPNRDGPGGQGAAALTL